MAQTQSNANNEETEFNINMNVPVRKGLIIPTSGERFYIAPGGQHLRVKKDDGSIDNIPLECIQAMYITKGISLGKLVGCAIFIAITVGFIMTTGFWGSLLDDIIALLISASFFVHGYYYEFNIDTGGQIYTYPATIFEYDKLQQIINNFFDKNGQRKY